MEYTSREQLAGIRDYLRQTADHTGKTAERIRREMAEAAAAAPLLPSIAVERVAVGPMNGEWLSPISALAEENVKQAVLYVHGGGFVAGSCDIYRDLAGRVAEASGVKVLTFEYRLAPEHPYPAAEEDVLTAYRWLLANGYSARRIVLGGDSVGASLALMLLLALRDTGEEFPAGAFLLSPHTDLVHLDGDSYRTHAGLDPTGSLEGNRAMFETYWGGRPGEKPALLSPLRSDLRGLPDLLIQVGDHEVLLSDATRFAERAEAVGVNVKLEIWEQMWCSFQLLAPMLPEARRAIAGIGRYVQATLSYSAAASSSSPSSST
ncbi:alpha/beta hydrolase [Paenibacillus hodogayensis]|uniref:Alpha/beta hydrolase n=1 Tax=Paenibacillus hodogayensis TaxID=279208 RepID=A0ABV5VYX2_9BACL